MYTPMEWIPAASIASTTEGYSHYMPGPCFPVIPMIRRAARWRNPSRTLRISPVTTQISLTYNSTNCVTALYIIPRARTVATIFASTLTIIPHPPPRFPQVLIHCHPIAFIIGDCPPEAREGLWRWQGLCIDLERFKWSVQCCLEPVVCDTLQIWYLISFFWKKYVCVR